jgi:hypothetical protein
MLCLFLCRLLSPPAFFFLEEEVANNEEGNADNTAAAAADTYTVGSDAAPNNNDYPTMPPKLKPAPRKPGTNRKSADVAEMPPLTPKPPANFSVDSINKFLVTYYCEGLQDHAVVVVHVNRVLCNGDYHMSFVMDGKSVLWQCRIQSVCLTKNILKFILKDAYSSSSHRVIAYDDVAQKMKDKKVKVLPEHKQFWGALQVCVC